MTDRLLRRALLGNALFSAVCGVTLLLLAAPLSNALELPVWLLTVIGVGLLPFAAIVALIARDPHLPSARAVIGADIAWVVAAVAVLVTVGSSMAPSAAITLGIVTVAVADFAVLQWVGLRRIVATS